MGTYLSRSGGIPRLQPVGLPAKPGVNGTGSQRFTTGRPAANGFADSLSGAKPRQPAPDGSGVRYLAQRQVQPPKAYTGRGGKRMSNPTLGY